MDPAEPNSGAHGATRTVFRTEVQWPPLPGRQSARRAGLSRGDVTLHGEFQGVGSHLHRGTQRPQQGGGGLVRAPGFEAAKLGQESVRGRGKTTGFTPGSFGLAKTGRRPHMIEISFSMLDFFVVAIKVVNPPCEDVPCANILALLLPSRCLCAPSPTPSISLPTSPAASGFSPPESPDQPLFPVLPWLFSLMPVPYLFVHSTVCQPCARHLSCLSLFAFPP